MKKAIESEKAQADMRKLRYLQIFRTIFCLCLVAVLCFGCALIRIGFLSARTRACWRDSNSQTDKIRIYIDQGHNPMPYHNNGAEGNGLYEQDLTFEIGLLLANLLIEDGRFEVCLSRPEKNTVLGTDVVSSLEARVNGAKDFHADYFISLHVNAFAMDTANGLEVFVSNGNGESETFGKALLQGMVDSTALNSRGVKSGTDLFVLEKNDLPAVLLEMGFISNPEDAALLSRSPELFAQGIYNGIVCYFESAYAFDITLLMWIIGLSTALGISSFIASWAIKKRSTF